MQRAFKESANYDLIPIFFSLIYSKLYLNYFSHNYRKLLTLSVGEREMLWRAEHLPAQENNIWLKKELRLDADYEGDYRFVMEATVAEGQHGDIAIDDVSLTPGCQ